MTDTRTFRAHGLDFVITSEVFVTDADFDTIRDHFQDMFELDSFEDAMKVHREQDGATIVGDILVSYEADAGRIRLISVEKL